MQVRLSEPGRKRLYTALRDPGAPEVLSDYYSSFTGRHFDRLDGGGNRPAVRNRITAEDIVAVTMLSVSVPAPIAVGLLEGDLADKIARLLPQIEDVDLHDDRAAVAPGSPAWEVWDLLDAQHGIGWVTAGKLLARKRPRLIPVYDAVIKCVLDAPLSAWLALRHELRADGDALVHELAALRHRAGISNDISLLRVLDVAMWRWHRDAHLAHECPAA